MFNIILSIKRTQVHCTQILSTLFTCLHVMINTDVKQMKCRLGANRETSPRNDDPLNFDSLITASK